MDSIWTQMALFALPSGFVGGVVTWLVTRQQRRNDFLSQMQQSIDLLSEQYNLVLRDNVTLRHEKAQWLVAQQELLLKVDRLTREVESLRKNINKQNKDNETNTSKASNISTRRDADGLRGNAHADHTEHDARAAERRDQRERKSVLHPPRRPRAVAAAVTATDDPEPAAHGGGCALAECHDAGVDREPP